MKTTDKIGLMAIVDDWQGAKIALRGVRANMYLFNNSLRVNLEQRYINLENTSIEAVYSFPLPIEATVCGFKVRVGEREIVGILEERETAFERYDSAIADGKTAYLLDADTPNHFTCSVGNLAPGEDVTVYLSYVQTLTMRDGIYRLVLPTQLAMVYTPDEVIGQMDPAELDRLYPPRSFDPLPYGLEINARVQIQDGIKALDCPSHTVKTTWEDDLAEVTFSSGTIAMGGDFILNITPKVLPKHIAYSCINHYGGGWIVYAQFLPEFIQHKTTPQNITFMLDCSGSMSGEGIQQAKSALLLLLASLQEGDRFNMVAYGSGYKLFSPSLLAYNDINLSKARAWVQKRDADMGGTEVLIPLLKVLETGKTVPQSIILLTDGDVGNTTQIISAVHQTEQPTRVFTIGLGLNTDENLLYNLARETGGVGEIVHPNERLEPVISRHLARIKGAQVQSMQLTWGDNEETIPVWNQHLLPGESKHFMKHFDTPPAGEVTLAVKLDTGESYCFGTGEVINTPQEFDALPQLYAKHLLQNMGIKHGIKQPIKEHKGTELDISLLYKILSPATSYILVDPESQHKNVGGVGLRRVTLGVNYSFKCRKTPSQNMAFQLPIPPSLLHLAIDSDNVCYSMEMPMFKNCYQPPSVKPALSDLIILSQSASGYWDDFSLLKQLHISKVKFAALVKDITAKGITPEEQAKFIALSLLIWTHLSYIDTEHRYEHQPLIDKAELWFTSQGIDYLSLVPGLKKLL